LTEPVGAARRSPLFASRFTGAGWERSLAKPEYVAPSGDI